MLVSCYLGVGSVLLQDEYNNLSLRTVCINMNSAHLSPEQRLQLIAEDVSNISSCQ